MKFNLNWVANWDCESIKHDLRILTNKNQYNYNFVFEPSKELIKEYLMEFPECETPVEDLKAIYATMASISYMQYERLFKPSLFTGFLADAVDIVYPLNNEKVNKKIWDEEAHFGCMQAYNSSEIM